MPETDRLITLLREQGFAAVVSGAGPSILVLGSDPGQRLAAADLVARNAQTAWQPLHLAVDFKGATVVPAAAAVDTPAVERP
jgi:homoserine kinase